MGTVLLVPYNGGRTGAGAQAGFPRGGDASVGGQEADSPGRKSSTTTVSGAVINVMWALPRGPRALLGLRGQHMFPGDQGKLPGGGSV